MDFHIHDVERGYDCIAKEYATRISGELQHKPFDRMLLDRFVSLVDRQGLVCDIGCGPGHVAGYLADHGLTVLGVDLSPAMVDEAQQLNPTIPFVQADMTQLDVGDDSWAGIVAFYSLIHIPRSRVTRVLKEFARVLQSGGYLLLAVHIGDTEVHLDEWWGKRVSMDVVFFQAAELVHYLQEAGFKVADVIERDPYLEVEYQSRRCYVLAQKVVPLSQER